MEGVLYFQYNSHKNIYEVTLAIVYVRKFYNKCCIFLLPLANFYHSVIIVAVDVYIHAALYLYILEKGQYS